MTRRSAGRLIAVGGLGLVWPSGCARVRTESRSSSPTTSETFDQTLERIRKANGLAGLAAAVVRGDRIVASGVTGVRRQTTEDKLQLNDRFHIASCTKSMTATLAAICVNRTQLKWTTTLAEALPMLANAVRPEYRSATLEQLLAHEARMPAFTQPSAPQVEQMKTLKGTPVQQRLAFLSDVLKNEVPNSGSGNAAYSNVGYAAVGSMVEKATGVSWEDLIQRDLATPLEMTSLGFGYPATTRNANQPRGHSEINGRIEELPFDESRQLAVCLWPAGAVHCSIGDLAGYAADHLNGLRGRRALLPRSIYEYLHRPRNASAFTLGWGAQTDKRWGAIHFGAGSGGWFFVRIVIVPEHDVAIVAASNSGHAGDATRELYTDLLERFAGGN